VNTAPNRYDPSGFDVVDAQVHLTLDMDESRLLASMDALGITGTILDEFWVLLQDQDSALPGTPLPGGAFRPLSLYAHGAAIRNPQRFKYIQRVERTDPELAAVIRMLGTSPECVAVRILLLSGADRSGFAEGAYDDILAGAQDQRLPVCVLGPDARTLGAVTDRFPRLDLVLDHCGYGRKTPQWEAVLDAANLPRVYLKWSHASRIFGPREHPAAPLAVTRAEFHRAVKGYGADRMLWTSDITEEESAQSWSQLLGFVRDDCVLSDAEKTAILGGTARQVFGWPQTNTSTKKLR
jgi:L-fuconolactonase